MAIYCFAPYRVPYLAHVTSLRRSTALLTSCVPVGLLYDVVQSMPFCVGNVRLFKIHDVTRFNVQVTGHFLKKKQNQHMAANYDIRKTTSNKMMCRANAFRGRETHIAT